MSVGPDGACGVTSGGSVACWTSHPSDASGPRDWVGFGARRRPRLIPTLDHALGVAVTADFACAWRTTGDVWCWGANQFGQLGDSSLETRSRPKPVRSSVRAEYVGVSSDGFACLLSTDARAYCWGSGDHGQLGQPRANASLHVPTPVAGDHRFQSLSVGADSHVCGVDRDGALWCWGENGEGQVGVSRTTTDVLTPVRVDPTRRFSAVSVGSSFTCAIDSAASLFCWGYNRDASLGVGDTTDHEGIQAVSDVRQVALVSAGFRRPCAVTLSQELVCWGLNDGAPPWRVTRPRTIARLSSRPIAMGADFGACTLDRVGTIQCWGRGNGHAIEVEVIRPPPRG
jgi:alpha-tubulin suppressor-like RCC1 family protein